MPAVPRVSEALPGSESEPSPQQKLEPLGSSRAVDGQRWEFQYR